MLFVRPYRHLVNGEMGCAVAPNPVCRLGRPDDIASAIAFLASPLADYITGVELRVDGGITGVS
ncbi:MAG: SDR family oxidoreductase [Williamsia sp.]|nr:SDR family oxidoreductase [Williamsia sp.]